MIHLYLAYKINPSGCGDYFLGCLAPDYVSEYFSATSEQGKRSIHLRTHLNIKFSNRRGETPTDEIIRDMTLTDFYTRIDKNNPFHMGYLVHLLCDWWYYSETMKMKIFANDDEHISEWRIVERNLRLNSPWMCDVFCKMEQHSSDLVYPIEGFGVEKVIAYKNELISLELRQQDEQAEKISPTILTNKFLCKLGDEIAAKYCEWVDKQSATIYTF